MGYTNYIKIINLYIYIYIYIYIMCACMFVHVCLSNINHIVFLILKTLHGYS